MKKQPNILFIMTDQLRGDSLGYAGHKDVKTPYLQQRVWISPTPTPHAPAA